jgi:AraC-like DNA-binding protein
LGDHVTALPLLEHETVQLGSGSDTFITRQALGRDLALFQTRISPKMIGHVVLQPEWILFMLPLHWHGDYIFNGLKARPQDVFMTCDPNGYTSVGEDRDTLAVGMRKARLVQDMRALSGGAQIPRLQDQRLVLPAAQSVRLRTRAMAAMAAMVTATCNPLGQGRFKLSPDVEGDVVSLFADLMVSQPAFRQIRDPDQVQPGKIVRAAVRANDIGSGDSVSLARLCEASGVSHTWLNKCFQDVYGTSPVAYLRARRLSEARARLIDQSAPPVSVKDVALSLGFTHLGRFAAEYHARFEEQPSESLLRTARG